LPAVVVRAFRFNPLRGAKGSRFRPVTGISLKGSVFEIAALQCRERFTQFLNALALKGWTGSRTRWTETGRNRSGLCGRGSKSNPVVLVLLRKTEKSLRKD
ncbi:MAG: hypothetical protein LBH90_03575, partial [Tannerella sp.]|nr:hypothetical protein [Tannerella sp.]